MTKVTFLTTWQNMDGTHGEKWLNCDYQTANALAHDFCAACADCADVECVSITGAKDLGNGLTW